MSEQAAEENGGTPANDEPAVNEENNNADIDPNDPMTGYKEQIPSGDG